MKTVFVDYDHIPSLPESCAAVGYFDGIHLGHQELIETALQQARAHHWSSAVLTFDPDPWTVFKPGADTHHLSTMADKEKILAHMGIELLIVVRFTREFAALSVDAFHQLLMDLNIRELVCGFDFTYGSQGKGNVQTLSSFEGIKTIVIDSVNENQAKISSSRIEEEVHEGKIRHANELLGSFYSLAGTIVHGYQRGRQMDFPTANLDPAAEYILPRSGVYAGMVAVEDRLYPAMINIGTNPTFANQNVSIEANLLNTTMDLYDRSVRFFFCTWLRGEEKFDSFAQLKAQLSSDQQRVLPALRENEKLLRQTVDLWSLKFDFDILKK